MSWSENRPTILRSDLFFPRNKSPISKDSEVWPYVSRRPKSRPDQVRSWVCYALKRPPTPLLTAEFLLPLKSRRCSVGLHSPKSQKDLSMSTGKVKWFNPTKGYGFIQPQGGGQDVFVHISAVERAGLSTLNENQDVEFEIVSNRGKNSAENLKVK